MAELGPLSCGALDLAGGEALDDVAVAAHLHADFGDDTSTVGLTSAGNCKRINATASGNCSSSRGQTQSEAKHSQPSFRSAKGKKEREAYDPELEKLVIGRAQELVQAQGEPQRTADYVNGDSLERVDLGEIGSEITPAVPPRKSQFCDTNTLSKQTVMLSGGGLGNLSEPSKAEFVIDGEHDYINQEHLDFIMEEQETSSEVRSKVSNGKGKNREIGELDGCTDDDEGHRILERGRASVRSTVSTTSSLFNLEPLKSSSGHKSQGPERVSISDHKQLGEFERRLLLAKQKGRAPMPSVMGIPWYHPGITRHISECLLLSREIIDGTYLMRQTGDTLAISVRCQSSTRHYRIVWDGKQFTFGLGKFPTVEALQTHFDNKPIISGESGIVVQLCNPYPRAVSEPAVYADANVVTTGLTDQEVEELQNQPLKQLKPPSSSARKILSSNNVSGGESSSASGGTSSSPSLNSSPSSAQHHPYLSINSMEGYLTKLGFHRKNWKRRWFVLYRNELKYFNNKDDKEPIKTINLEDATSVTRDDTCGKSHCFRLVTGYRTFFMYAVSDTQANEWVQMLQWKLSTLQKQSPPKH